MTTLKASGSTTILFISLRIVCLQFFVSTSGKLKESVLINISDAIYDKSLNFEKHSIIYSKKTGSNSSATPSISKDKINATIVVNYTIFCGKQDKSLVKNTEM